MLLDEKTWLPLLTRFAILASAAYLVFSGEAQTLRTWRRTSADIERRGPPLPAAFLRKRALYRFRLFLLALGLLASALLLLLLLFASYALNDRLFWSLYTVIMVSAAGFGLTRSAIK